MESGWDGGGWGGGLGDQGVEVWGEGGMWRGCWRIGALARRARRDLRVWGYAGVRVWKYAGVRLDSFGAYLESMLLQLCLCQPRWFRRRSRRSPRRNIWSSCSCSEPILRRLGLHRFVDGCCCSMWIRRDRILTSIGTNHLGLDRRRGFRCAVLVHRMRHSVCRQRHIPRLRCQD